MSDVLAVFNSAKKEVPEHRYVLPGSGKEVLFRPFTTKDQKSILKAIEKNDSILIQEAFDQLLRNCVLTPNFDVEGLYSKDRECLLIELSKESVRDEFTQAWECKMCGKEHTEEFKIEDLKYEEVIEDSIKSVEVEFEDVDFVVKLNNPSRGDEKKILALGKKKGENGEISQTEVLLATFASVIKEYKSLEKRSVKDDQGETVEEEFEQFKAIKFDDRIKIFDQLTIRDKKKIEEFFNGVKNYGYDLKLGDKECKKCSEENEVEADWFGFFLT